MGEWSKSNHSPKRNGPFRYPHFGHKSNAGIHLPAGISLLVDYCGTKVTSGRLCFLFESDQECHRESSDPPNTESQKIKLKSHPVWLRLGGSKRCHLPVICLGKTRHNPNIIIILMFGFFVVFYRETKWPKWTQMVNFSMVWRLPGRHRKRCDDVLGAKAGRQRGRSADTKHRNSKKKASIGENAAHLTHIGHK